MAAAFFSNVPYSTTEDYLHEIFSHAGEIVNLQLFRKPTGESRGMGVVTFADPNSVQIAVETLRDVDVGDRKMWVSTHNKTPELERGHTGHAVHAPVAAPAHVAARAPIGPNTNSKVFFSNVPFHVGEDQLRSLFSEVGIVTELTIFAGKDGQSRGMGHCTFQAASQAAAAIGFLRDRDVGGRPIWIAEDVKAASKPQIPAPAPVIPVPMHSQPSYGITATPATGRIFFGNVPFDVHEAQLEQVFRSIGPITDIHLMRTSDGKSRGMGHVTYQTAELAAFAIQQLLDTDVGGRPILVKEDRSGPAPLPVSVPSAAPGMLRSKAPRGPPRAENMATSSRVFFSNVPYTVSEQELLSLFRQVGSVLELNLFQNEMGRSRGMGHCLFQSPQEAQMAIQELRDVDVAGRPIWIAEDSKGGKGPPMSGRSQPY